MSFSLPLSDSTNILTEKNNVDMVKTLYHRGVRIKVITFFIIFYIRKLNDTKLRGQEQSTTLV